MLLSGTKGCVHCTGEGREGGGRWGEREDEKLEKVGDGEEGKG